MYVKQSLFTAEKEAKELSLKFPEKNYYVIDKKHGETICSSVEWIIKHKIVFENYFPICKYKNGIRY